MKDQTEVIDLLDRLAFALETVAHLQGLELELLPLCGEARDMAVSLSETTARGIRSMCDLLDEYEAELVRAANQHD